jgi:hypothetical protein
VTRSSAHVGAVIAATCLTCALITLAGFTPVRSASPLPGTARAEIERPLPAHTGGFGEPTCGECHIQADVNAGTGSLTLAGLPLEYVGGVTYTLTIALAQQGLAAGGFQLSSRFADGTQAGTLAHTMHDSARVAVTTAGEVQYIHHVYAGTRRSASDTASDTIAWQIRWTAPVARGRIVFHVAANAADDDASPLGDMIYATSLSTVPGK